MTVSSQRFSIIDLLSLVAAFAISFAMFVFHRRQWATFDTDWTAINALSVNWFGFGLTLCVCSFYLGLMVLRRRPNRDLLANSPGRAATLATCLASLLVMLTSWDLFFASIFSFPVTLLHLPFSIGSYPLVAGTAGLTAWLAVAATNDNHLSPDWLDRSGKICTVFWLLLSVVQPVLNLEVLKTIGFPLD